MRWFVIPAIVLFLVAVLGYWFFAPGPADELAECLSDKGVAFYSAYWCPHCKEQKAMFGKSFEKLVAFECADPVNPRKQAEVCAQANIRAYPTWEFADGERYEGVLSFEELKRRAGC